MIWNKIVFAFLFFLDIFPTVKTMGYEIGRRYFPTVKTMGYKIGRRYATCKYWMTVELGDRKGTPLPRLQRSGHSSPINWSFSICLLTLKIIPNAMDINKNDVPPLLISGRVRPATGMR